jgi:hypothetical protein
MSNDKKGNKVGRPNIYGEQLTSVTFSCPVSLRQELKAHVRAFLLAHAELRKARVMESAIPESSQSSDHAS